MKKTDSYSREYLCSCCEAYAEPRTMLDSYIANLCTRHNNELTEFVIDNLDLKVLWVKYGVHKVRANNADTDIEAEFHCNAVMNITPQLVTWAKEFISTYEEHEDENPI